MRWRAAPHPALRATISSLRERAENQKGNNPLPREREAVSRSLVAVTRPRCATVVGNRGRRGYFAPF